MLKEGGNGLCFGEVQTIFQKNLYPFPSLPQFSMPAIAISLPPHPPALPFTTSCPLLFHVAITTSPPFHCTTTINSLPRSHLFGGYNRVEY